MEKLYVISYELIGVGRHEEEKNTLFFGEDEQDKFISKYIHLKGKWNVQNMKTYKTEKIVEIDLEKLLNF